MHQLQPGIVSRNVVLAAVVAAFVGLPSIANAESKFLDWFNGLYTKSYNCGVCHTTSGGFSGNVNDFGDDWVAAGGRSGQSASNSAFRSIEGTDSDGDGSSNLTEILLDFHPGYTCANYTNSIFGDATANNADPNRIGCVDAPDINLNPPSLDFGSVVIGQAGTLTTAVENVGSAALDVTMVNLCLGTSGEFSFSPSGPFTVAAGASRTLTVTYTPANTGQDTGCLQLASNDPDENLIDLNVAATGAQAPVPDINLNPPSLDFGSVVIGQAGTLAATIENVGTANLEVTMVNLCSATSAEFSWAPAGPFTIAPGMNQSLNVTYTPVNTGPDSGCLRLTSNDPDENPIDLNVMATGAQAPEPDINLSPSALDFGTVDIGMSAALRVSVENLGTANLDVSAVSLCSGTSAEFTWAPTDAFTVAPGMSWALDVTYTPGDAGPDTGCVRLASNDPDENPIDLNVMGTGFLAATPDINLNPHALDFGGLEIGTSATLSVNVENLGTSNLDVSMVNLCSGTSTEFTWAPAGAFTVPPGMSQALDVTYNAGNAGQDTGCLQLASNDPDESSMALDVVGRGILRDELAVDFGANGFWHFDAGVWTLASSLDPADMVAWGSKTAVSFGTGVGLYVYDGDTVEYLSDRSPVHMVAWGNKLVVAFGSGMGLWTYDASGWTQLTVWDPVQIAPWGDKLAVAFGAGRGLWSHDGSGWTNLAAWDSYDFVAWGDRLAVAFDAGRGLWIHDAGVWSQLTPWEPTKMTPRTNDLAVAFGSGLGLWLYDSTGWANLTSWDPYDVVDWNDQVVAAFDAGRGLWLHDGSSWIQLTELEPTGLEAFADKLAVALGVDLGLYTFDGAAWANLTMWTSEAAEAVDLNP